MGFRRPALLAILLASAAVLAGCPKQISEDDIQHYSLDQFRKETEPKKKAQVLIVDARDRDAFAAGHIPGALNMQIDAINLREPIDPHLAKYDEIIVYGNDPGSPAAHGLVKRMLTVGYPAYLYDGGWEEWTRKGLPVEKGLVNTRP